MMPTYILLFFAGLATTLAIIMNPGGEIRGEADTAEAVARAMLLNHQAAQDHLDLLMQLTPAVVDNATLNTPIPITAGQLDARLAARHTGSANINGTNRPTGLRAWWVRMGPLPGEWMVYTMIDPTAARPPPGAIIEALEKVTNGNLMAGSLQDGGAGATCADRSPASPEPQPCANGGRDCVRSVSGMCRSLPNMGGAWIDAPVMASSMR